METINVVVAPIALESQASGQLRVALYRPARGWVEDQARVEVEQTAQELLLGRTPAREGVVAEPVGFTTDGKTVRLIYTAALPLRDTAIEGSSRDWVQLAPSVDAGQLLDDCDATHQQVLQYWRQQLEETTAAFDLLPRYFTTSQVHAVYTSIWGKEQNAANFHRWLHQRQDVVTSATKEEVREQVHDDLAARAASARIGDDLRPDALHDDRLVGISSVALGALAASIPALGVAAAATSAAVAYQRRKNQGAPPKWWQRRDARRVPLSDIYHPRPAWLETTSDRPGPDAAD